LGKSSSCRPTQKLFCVMKMLKNPKAHGGKMAMLKKMMGGGF